MSTRRTICSSRKPLRWWPHERELRYRRWERAWATGIVWLKCTPSSPNGRYERDQRLPAGIVDWNWSVVVKTRAPGAWINACQPALWTGTMNKWELGKIMNLGSTPASRPRGLEPKMQRSRRGSTPASRHRGLELGRSRRRVRDRGRINACQPASWTGTYAETNLAGGHHMGSTPASRHRGLELSCDCWVEAFIEHSRNRL